MALETHRHDRDVDMDRIARVLQPVAHVPYAPPHVFPMSVPDFRKASGVGRPEPGRGPLGLYLHVPFCRYACNFCFYVKRIGAGRSEMEGYVRALERELRLVPEGTPVAQLFVGGGTPTALPPELLDELLTAVFDRVDRSAESIHTVECSPETVTEEHLDVLRRHGVRRVSLGVQTFRDELLRRVHRRHTGEEALEACRELAASGLMVNADLIYGLPGQTGDMFRDDFSKLASAKVACINAYSLRVNEATPVRRLLAGQERLELEQLLAWRSLVQHAASRTGYEQRHWQRFMRPGTDFELELTSPNLFGLGVSARSFLGGCVYRNHTKLRTYRERVESGKSPVEEVFPLDSEHRKTHFITRTLGAGKPLDYGRYAERFGGSFWVDYGDVCRRLLDIGVVEDRGEHLAMSPTGRLLYDVVTLAFYPEALQRWLRERHRRAMAT